MYEEMVYPAMKRAPEPSRSSVSMRLRAITRTQCAKLAPEPPALLVQRHAAVSAALENLKASRATRAAERRELEANLVGLHAELHDEAEGPPVAAADLATTTFAHVAPAHAVFCRVKGLVVLRVEGGRRPLPPDLLALVNRLAGALLSS